MTFVYIALTAALSVLALPAAYLLLLTFAGLFVRRNADQSGTAPGTRFAILVPAHNEAKLLPLLLESLRNNDYPTELYEVFVVADNCTDSTAEIGRSLGAVVYERNDTQLRGKPHALKWLIGQLSERSEDFDAYLFLDADSQVSSKFLAAMDRNLRDGYEVVQSYYAVSNPAASSLSALRYIAFVLKHNVRPMGKRALGLSCGLFGTGMAFSREIIERYGWESFTLAEDIEHFMKLTNDGVEVRFAHEAVLWSDMPTSFEGARGQNLRWERGRLDMARRFSLPFLVQGLLKGNMRKVDAAIEQLIPPMSITYAAGAVLLLLTLPTLQPWLIGLGIAVNAALLTHLVLGLIIARAPVAVYRAFAFAPAFVAWKLLIYVQAMALKELPWVRTQRPQ